MLRIGDFVTLNSSYTGWRRHQIGMKARILEKGAGDYKVEFENGDCTILNRNYFSPFTVKKKFHPLTEIFK